MRTLATLALSAGILMASDAQAQEGATMAATTEERLKQGADVVLKLNGGVPRTVLESMRREFPFLADATQAYALGDIWTRPGLDDRTRQLAAVAVFAEHRQSSLHAPDAMP
ncbi:MAG: hypothetical protein RLY86_4150 [Pseudomonadota bacterium]